jgi:hypothetical protein
MTLRRTHKSHPGDSLPKFITPEQLSARLSRRGVILPPEELVQLATVNKLPAFYIDADRSRPMFTWESVERWIIDNMLWHSVGSPVKIQVVVPHNNPPLAKSGIPLALSTLDYLYEYGQWRAPCIYFLCKAGRVVYVGQSVSLTTRVLQHAAKEYDRVFYVLVAESHLNEVERQFIELLDPPLNRQRHKPMVSLV